MRKPSRIYWEKFFSDSDRYYPIIEDNSGSCEGIRLATKDEVSAWKKYKQTLKPKSP